MLKPVGARETILIGPIQHETLGPPLPDPAEIRRLELPAVVKRKLARNLKDYSALKEREERALRELRRNLPSRTRILTAPDLSREPRSIADLAEIARRLEPATF